MWFKVVVALLVLCIIYSAIQTAYIYRLNVGLEGLTTYLDRGEDKLAGKEAEEAEDMSAEIRKIFPSLGSHLKKQRAYQIRTSRLLPLLR